MILLADWTHLGSSYLGLHAIVVRYQLMLRLPEGSTWLDTHGSSLNSLLLAGF